MRDVATGCPRRLALAHRGHRRDFQADARFAVSNAIEEHARLAQLEEQRPDPTVFRPDATVTPEERAVYEHATRWYLFLYGDRIACSFDLGDSEWGRDRPDLGIRLTSRRPLVFESAQGPELRILRLNGAPARTDLLDDLEVRVDILRLAGEVATESLQVYVSDLVRGEHAAATISIPAVARDLELWLRDAIEEVRAAVDADGPRIGADCAWCPYVAGCPAHAP